jgi:DNA-binding response OmpR family regulator
MKTVTILWADDEIDLLRPHILFLQDKGYRVLTATNGNDALKSAAREDIDIVFLDENMPGKSGLEILNDLKQMIPNVPVVMITKSEEENIMDQAIGSKISDYLIKPVNPSQILLVIKKNIDNVKLISEKVTADYRSEFNKLGISINTASQWTDWIDVYKKLVFWELQMDNSSQDMMEILTFQKAEANKEFAKFIKNNYASWFKPETKTKPVLSASVMKQYVFAQMSVHPEQKLAFILVDNLRYDHWQILSKTINAFCKIETEDLYFSILPTATQYARNAIFAGLMPLEIEKILPDLWTEEDDDQEQSKNSHEEDLLKKQMSRLGIKGTVHYEKVQNEKYAKKLVDSYSNHKNNDLIAVVYNFVDALSHARTDVNMIRELADNEAAYRSLIQSWFQHSQLLEFLKVCIDDNRKIILTTDHGTVRVFNPVKVVGDRDTSANLRYKMGRNLNYNTKDVFDVRKPSDIHLPGMNLSSSFIFAMNADFLVYPNNYNHFANYYRNTFQHGGVSLEEMIIPVVVLSPK